MMAKTKFRTQLINGLKNPATILGDAWEFASCWVKYCSWSSFFILASPGLVIFLAISILFGIGAVESKKMILLRYVTAAERIAPVEEKKESAEKGATEKPSEDAGESSSKEATKEDKARQKRSIRRQCSISVGSCS